MIRGENSALDIAKDSTLCALIVVKSICGSLDPTPVMQGSTYLILILLFPCLPDPCKFVGRL